MHGPLARALGNGSFGTSGRPSVTSGWRLRLEERARAPGGAEPSSQFRNNDLVDAKPSAEYGLAALVKADPSLEKGHCRE